MKPAIHKTETFRVVLTESRCVERGIREDLQDMRPLVSWSNAEMEGRVRRCTGHLDY